VVDDAKVFNDKLQEWENFYNYHRPHGGLGGETPVTGHRRARAWRPGAGRRAVLTYHDPHLPLIRPRCRLFTPAGLREFGLWVALPQPSAERMNDGQADDEDADAYSA